VLGTLLNGIQLNMMDLFDGARSQIEQSRIFYPYGKMRNRIKLPKHVGFIMDGNRRFARRQNKPVLEGHAKGAATGYKVLEWWLKYVPKSEDAHVPSYPKCLTYWAFSSENFSRTAEEKAGLFRLMEVEFKTLAYTSLVHLFGIRVCVIGGEREMEQLPDGLRNAIQVLESSTRNYDNLVLLLAVGYGGKREIIESVEKVIAAGKPLNEDSIGAETYCASVGVPSVDMIIRTSEKRTSGFFLWDTQGAELHFIDKLWPELNERDWLGALDSFSNRQMRGGK